MSHTCGKQAVREHIAEYLKGCLAEAEKYPVGAARMAWFEAHIERAIKSAEHIAECMDPGPSDPSPEQD